MKAELAAFALNNHQYDPNRHYVKSEESPELQAFFKEVRELCLDQIETMGIEKPNLFYKEDVEKLKKQEWLIRRFMAHHKGDKLEEENPKKTADTIIKCLLWKKKMRLREMKPEEYPREFFLAGIYGRATTRDGETLIHITGNAYKKERQLTPHIKEFVHCMIEKIDNELNGGRVIIFLDLSGVPLRNADISIIYYFTLVALNYYRRIVQRCIVYEAPWYLWPFISLILAISPRYKALLTQVDKNNLFEVLDPEDVPVTLGGKLDTHVDPPEGCWSGAEYARNRGIPEKDMIRCLELYGFSPPPNNTLSTSSSSLNNNNNNNAATTNKNQSKMKKKKQLTSSKSSSSSNSSTNSC